MKTTKIIALVVVAMTSVACAASSEEEESAPTDVKDVKIEADDTEPAYGSTYNSNCLCLACIKYCQVDGKTYKDGVCC